MKNIKAGVFLAVLLFFGTHLNAQTAIKKLNTNYYVAGPTSTEFQSIVSTQRCQNWCWATCVQMVLNYHGLYVQQEQIVGKVYGRSLPCKTGNAQHIMRSLTGWAPDARGRFSQIYAKYGVYNSADIVDQLSRKWPIIVGLRQEGHCYVLTAVYFSYDRYDNPIIDKVVLRDPWPLSPSRKVMNWNTFLAKQPEFFKVWVNRM
ncbi:C39 family peptidase [Kordia sp. YSTF-M3]|uniref:C39 family peptidase n=1 Tax=Kordia aestuariivivens TaxID=2759037 RepID=A0ABR7Q5K6_9FLAO|nr:papain-like cysteine protease family protein [Kordia aestuariivivens]MBC8753839.1 C39 family peptidase [Kordia aestuariivivens]